MDRNSVCILQQHVLTQATKISQEKKSSDSSGISCVTEGPQANTLGHGQRGRLSQQCSPQQSSLSSATKSSCPRQASLGHEKKKTCEISNLIAYFLHYAVLSTTQIVLKDYNLVVLQLLLYQHISLFYRGVLYIDTTVAILILYQYKYQHK